MNNTLQSLIFSLALVGGTEADPLGSVDQLATGSPVATMDAGDHESYAQVDMDTALRSRTKVKHAPGSTGNDGRIGDLEPNGEVAVGFGDFLKCWWDRDLEGGGSDFTGGCWDRNMGSSDESAGGSESEEQARSARA